MLLYSIYLTKSAQFQEERESKLGETSWCESNKFEARDEARNIAMVSFEK